MNHLFMQKTLKYKQFIIILIFFFLPVYSAFSQANVLRDSLVQFAYRYIETPYRSGGSSPRAFDCSGFTSFVYKNFGYQLNRSSGDQIKNAQQILKRTELQPGDLVFFKGRNSKRERIGHVGIVTETDSRGNFKFIHASCQQGVVITNCEEDYYKKRYVSAARIVPERYNSNKLDFLTPLPINPIEINPIEVKILEPIYSNLRF